MFLVFVIHKFTSDDTSDERIVRKFWSILTTFISVTLWFFITLLVRLLCPYYSFVFVILLVSMNLAQKEKTVVKKPKARVPLQNCRLNAISS